MAEIPNTLHWSNADVEVHRVVVGPVDNNVFFVVCRRTGESIMIDAANEHELLLQLCRRFDVRRVLETHGHWDHIEADPRSGLRGRRDRAGRPDAERRRVRRLSRRRRGDRGRHPPPPRDPQPRPHARVDLVRRRGHAVAVHRRHPVPGWTGSHPIRGRRLRRHHRVDRHQAVHVPGDTIVLPGHGDDTTIGTERPHLQEWVDRGW